MPEPSPNYIAISKGVLLSGQNLDDESLLQFNEAKSRFLSAVTTIEGGYHIIDKSADEINICADLYDLFYIAYVALPNARVEINSSIISKSGEEYVDSLCVDDFPVDSLGPTGTRGNNRIVDAIASSIETLTSSLGWDTTAKFWHMWYFDARENAYTLTEIEWLSVKSFAESEYRNHPNWAPGWHSISFSFQSDPDLHFTYGTASVYFNYEGSCVEFRDNYDMNFLYGRRDDLDELITRFLSYIGGTEAGFEIHYGTH